MAPRLALLASPLLGPAVWKPAGRLLERAGWSVVVPALRPTGLRTAADVLAGFLEGLPADDELVLVPHSNAGLYAAALGMQRRVRAVLYVDAGLPALDGPTPVAPPQFRDFLEDLADSDGLLPPWTRWWPPADVAALFPDATTRELVESEQRQLPLGYFRGTVAAAAGARVSSAYLSFGSAYAEQAAVAGARGWPVAQLAGGHLHMLVDPAEVAAAITGLLAALGVRPEAPERAG